MITVHTWLGDTEIHTDALRIQMRQDHWSILDSLEILAAQTLALLPLREAGHQLRQTSVAHSELRFKIMLKTLNSCF